MKDYEQLVKALRCKRDDCEGCDLAFLDNDEGWMCQYAAKDDDAADAIEALQAETERLTKENRELYLDRPELEEVGGKWVWREPKRGEWTEIEDYDGDFHYQCSVCGEEWYFIDGTPADNNANYCPRCGAKMEVQDEA